MIFTNEIIELKNIFRQKILNFLPLLLKTNDSVEEKQILENNIKNLFSELFEILNNSKLDLKNKEILIEILNKIDFEIKIIMEKENIVNIHCEIFDEFYFFIVIYLNKLIKI